MDWWCFTLLTLSALLYEVSTSRAACSPIWFVSPHPLPSSYCKLIPCSLSLSLSVSLLFLSLSMCSMTFYPTWDIHIYIYTLARVSPLFHFATLVTARHESARDTIEYFYPSLVEKRKREREREKQPVALFYILVRKFKFQDTWKILLKN